MAKSKSGGKGGERVTSESICSQTRDYLESGGKIDVIQTGVTGLPYAKAPKSLVINKDK